MDKLMVSLSALPEDGLTIDSALDSAILGWPNGSASPIHVRGRLQAIDAEFLFNGTIDGSCTQPCDRCLRIGTVPYTLEVAWFFEPGEQDDSLDLGEVAEESNESASGEPARYFSGNELDLTEHVRQEILLAAPAKFLCNEDCEGLCAQCGANLNDGPCGCVQETTTGHPGLAKLAEQFPDLRPVED